ncbi:MAG: hypothetical protein ACRC62_24810, partial [Microcoleus sp.]
PALWVNIVKKIQDAFSRENLFISVPDALILKKLGFRATCRRQRRVFVKNQVFGDPCCQDCYLLLCYNLLKLATQDSQSDEFAIALQNVAAFSF